MTQPEAPPAGDAALPARYRRSRILNVVLGALVAFLAIVVFAQLSGGSAPGAQPQPTAGGSAAQRPEVERRDPADPAAIGDVDAPVVLVEWLDLRCPYCALFSRDTLPTIVDEYVDAGQVRVEFRDVAFFGEQSEAVAVAARAAGSQGLYVEYATAVYDAAPESGQPDMPREKLVGFAEQIGVPDLARFTADLDDPDLLAQVRADTVAAQRLGVTSVPFFVAGDTALAGAQPADAFRQLLDGAIAKAR